MEPTHVTAIRELKEETGIELDIFDDTIDLIDVDEFISKIDKTHILTFIYFAKTNQEPVNMEPHKCEGWQWFDIDKLPKIWETEGVTLYKIKKVLNQEVV